MNKQKFLEDLRAGLKGLPQTDIEERIGFYSEMIDDRVEEGATEEEAVVQIGTVDEIVSQIIAETPLPRLLKEKVKKKTTLSTLEIILLVLGSPIWLSLLVSVFSALFSAYVSIWAVVIVLWAVEISLWACGGTGVCCGILYIALGNALPGCALLGGGIFLIGAAIFASFGCDGASKGVVLLTKKVIFLIKSLFIGKESEK